MKLKATKKEIKSSFNTIISIGYCNAQYLLYYKNPFAYSAGVYGWACDYYNIGNKCISTGYSPIGKNLDYKLLGEYEKKAQSIVLDFAMDHATKERKVDELLNELLSL